MLRLYNTLSKKIEEFISIKPMEVGLYSCGPTVYDYQHIGHMKKYIGDDILVRVLRANGYKVKHVMNITDVGHLVSDEDTGEDKMEKGAKKYGMSVWDIAKKFEKQFLDSIDAVNILRPSELMHATDYIPEQIALIQILEKKGYTYEIPEDGIYYDTSKFPTYFALSHQNPDELKKGARVEFVEGKRNVADFALWKFSKSTPDVKGPNTSGVSTPRRQMEWDSPWRVGFPGWHIECSAMSMKALGPHFDIHTGGIDHIAIHHTNEIAQSEAATGEKFVNYWVHHNFLVVNNEKMSKSLGNFYTVQDLIEKGYDPLSLRYLILQTHYRQEMNFTWESLDAAQTALERLRKEFANLSSVIASEAKQSRSKSKIATSTSSPRNDDQWMDKFMNALNDDLNTSKALSVVWEMVKDKNLLPGEKKGTLLEMDRLLGLDLAKSVKRKALSVKIPKEVEDLVKEREAFRKAGDFAASDEIRKKIFDLGYAVEDRPEGPRLQAIQKRT